MDDPADRPSPLRRVAGGTGDLVLGIGATLLLVEVGVRIAAPTPPAQVIRPGKVATTEVRDGVPLWTPHDLAAWRHLDCPRERGPRVVFVGDSIFYGTGLPHEASLPARLQARFDAEGLDVCVHDLAVPGFVLEQQKAVWDGLRERLAPALVVWEGWSNGDGHYVELDGTFYFTHRNQLTADGGIPAPFGPDALHRWLMPRSRAWELLALSRLAADPGPTTTPEGVAAWRAVVDDVRAGGNDLLLVQMPSLDRPFAQWLAEHPLEPGAPTALPVEIVAREAGVDLLRAAEGLRGHDVEAVRMDPCCHYDAAGHAALADWLAPILRARLGLPPPP